MSFLFHHRNLDASRPRAHVTPRRLCSARLRPGSGPAQLRLRSAHPVYAPRRSQDSSHQKSSTFNEGSERCPPPLSQGSRICDHCKGDLSRLPLPFASFLSHLPSHLLTYLLSYLFDLSPISPARPFFLVLTPDIYIRAYKTLYTINTVRNAVGERYARSDLIS
jgi:hypothetical protein